MSTMPPAAPPTTGARGKLAIDDSSEGSDRETLVVGSEAWEVLDAADALPLLGGEEVESGIGEIDTCEELGCVAMIR